MKKVLIISPYFPPVNAPDMQRTRMSLPYFKEFGWEAEVVCINDQFIDLVKDDLLLQSIPADVIIHKVAAFPKKITSKFGLGSIALRSLWFYHQKVMLLLQAKNYDLIYFSTTEFPVCILGRMWKKRFGVPYVIDMQDPWHSNYHQNKPKNERPPKHWFSYRLNKFLEPLAMKKVDGIISVSAAYIETLKARYPEIQAIPASTITFGVNEKDFEIARKNSSISTSILRKDKISVVYVGVVGNIMKKTLTVLFKSLSAIKKTDWQLFDRFHFYFIGTSYAPKGTGKPTVMPVASNYNLQGSVTEQTDRIGFYSTINTLLAADALFIPGSADPQYTASKIYPYILTKKPLLAIFNSASPAIAVFKEFGVKHIYNYEQVTNADLMNFFKCLLNADQQDEKYNPVALNKYSARQMTLNQCLLFDQVTDGKI